MSWCSRNGPRSASNPATCPSGEEAMNYLKQRSNGHVAHSVDARAASDRPQHSAHGLGVAHHAKQEGNSALRVAEERPTKALALLDGICHGPLSIRIAGIADRSVTKNDCGSKEIHTLQKETLARKAPNQGTKVERIRHSTQRENVSRHQSPGGL